MAQIDNRDKKDKEKVPDSHGIWLIIRIQCYQILIAHGQSLGGLPTTWWQENVAIFTELSNFTGFMIT